MSGWMIIINYVNQIYQIIIYGISFKNKNISMDDYNKANETLLNIILKICLII